MWFFLSVLIVSRWLFLLLFVISILIGWVCLCVIVCFFIIVVRIKWFIIFGYYYWECCFFFGRINCGYLIVVLFYNMMINGKINFCIFVFIFIVKVLERGKYFFSKWLFEFYIVVWYGNFCLVVFFSK